MPTGGAESPAKAGRARKETDAPAKRPPARAPPKAANSWRRTSVPPAMRRSPRPESAPQTPTSAQSRSQPAQRRRRPQVSGAEERRVTRFECANSRAQGSMSKTCGDGGPARRADPCPRTKGQAPRERNERVRDGLKGQTEFLHSSTQRGPRKVPITLGPRAGNLE